MIISDIDWCIDLSVNFFRRQKCSRFADQITIREHVNRELAVWNNYIELYTSLYSFRVTMILLYLICEMINSRHGDLAKYHKNITSRIISMSIEMCCLNFFNTYENWWVLSNLNLYSFRNVSLVMI